VRAKGRTAPRAVGSNALTTRPRSRSSQTSTNPVGPFLRDRALGFLASDSDGASSRAIAAALSRAGMSPAGLPHRQRRARRAGAHRRLRRAARVSRQSRPPFFRFPEEFSARQIRSRALSMLREGPNSILGPIKKGFTALLLLLAGMLGIWLQVDKTSSTKARVQHHLTSYVGPPQQRSRRRTEIFASAAPLDGTWETNRQSSPMPEGTGHPCIGRADSALLDADIFVIEPSAEVDDVSTSSARWWISAGRLRVFSSGRHGSCPVCRVLQRRIPAAT